MKTELRMIIALLAALLAANLMEPKPGRYYLYQHSGGQWYLRFDTSNGNVVAGDNEWILNDLEQKDRFDKFTQAERLKGKGTSK